MKGIVQRSAVVVSLLACAGCLAVKMPQTPSEMEKTVISETKRIGRAEVLGVEPLIRRTDDRVDVSIGLSGAFQIEKQTQYRIVGNDDEFVAVGIFPGVMSCSGEYGDCIPNALGASFYNLVFAGLPTVYGLLIEPFVPHYPRQTDSIVGKKGFLKSALIGFTRYSKTAEAQEKQEKTSDFAKKIPLEDAVIRAPELGLESVRGEPLHIPVSRLPGDGEVKVKLRLPADHPLKNALSGFEDVAITVQCPN